MKNFFILFFCFFLYLSLPAQTPPIVWEKSFGGTRGDFIYDMCVTQDGRIAVCGSSNSVNYDLTCKTDSLNLDYWIFCTDTLGNLLWSKCYGGSLNDEPFAIDTTVDGGFIVAGYAFSTDGDVSGSHGGGGDYWIIKLDSFGDMVWSRCYGGSNGEKAYDIISTSDDGYLISGQSGSNDGDVTGHHESEFSPADYWIAKIDSIGTLQWQKSLGGTGYDYAMAGIEFSKGKYIVGGQSASSDGDLSFTCPIGCYWIVMLDSMGNIVWDRAYGGSGGDQCRKLLKTQDKKILCFGMSDSDDIWVTDNHGGDDYMVVAIDSSGSFLWSHAYGGAGQDLARGIALTPDSGFIAIGLSQNSAGTGQITNNYGENDYWVIKADINGNLQWEKNLGGTEQDEGWACVVMHQSIYLSGYTGSHDVDVSYNHDPGGDGWLLKLGGYTGIETVNIEPQSLSFIPNPAHNEVEITGDGMNHNSEVSVTDLRGKLVYQEKYTGKDSLIINTEHFANGFYLIILRSKDQVATGKLFILHH